MLASSLLRRCKNKKHHIFRSWCFLLAIEIDSREVRGNYRTLWVLLVLKTDVKMDEEQNKTWNHSQVKQMKTEFPTFRWRLQTFQGSLPHALAPK